MSVPTGAMESAKLTAEGMAQFERLHGPVKETGMLVAVSEEGISEEEPAEFVVCTTCKTDFPCPRMATMLIVQGMAMLQSMIPSGNMAAVLSRFAGGKGS